MRPGRQEAVRRVGFILNRVRPIHLIAFLCVILYGNWIVAIARFQPNMLFMDQWDYLNPLFNHEGWQSRFLQQQGPVREGLGLIITGWILEATAWDIRYDSLWGATMLLVATMLAARLKWKMTGTLRFSDAWIPLVFLSLGQFETVLSTPNQSHSVLPLALILLTANVWLSTRRAVRYLGAGALGVMLTFTGFGLFAGGIIGVLLAARLVRHALAREYRSLWSAAIGLTAIVVGWYRFSIGYTFQPAVEGFRFPWTPWTDYVRFIVLMLNLPSAHLGEASRHYLFGSILALIVAGTAVYTASLLVRRGTSVNDDVLVLCTWSGVLYVITTAVGRIPLGVTAGATPRYLSLMLPIWFAVYLLAARFPRRLLPAATLLLGLFALLPYSSMGRQPLAEWPGAFGVRPWQHDVMVFFGITKVVWADNYVATGSWESAQAAVVQPIHPSPAGSRFDEKLRFLREHKLTFFASPDRRSYLPWLADDRFKCPTVGSSPHACR
jgi:hypothetical protein